ncbi:MAG: hypothetical protein KKC43_08240 [Alphaproteobacteria bacterium]|nr:hypothetical protein [Alphaproteobacteria bacterium]
MSRLKDIQAALAAQMTPRLAYGLSAFLALGLGYGLLQLHDARKAAEADVSAARSELALVSQTDGVDLWKERAEQARIAREAWIERRWRGATPGIASAEAQAAAAALLAKTGLESVKLSVSSDPVRVGSEDLLRYEIAGVGDSHVLMSLLVELSTASKSFIITEVSAPLRDKQRTRLSLGGYLPYLPSDAVLEEAP